MSNTLRVVAAGIESEVATRDEDPIGHVVMADVDDAEPEPLTEDVSVVVETRGGTHLWGLAPRSWGETLSRLRDVEAADAEYVDEMDRRGRATLRTSPELSLADGRELSPAPVPVEVTIPSDADRVSAPHARRLADLATDGSAIEAELSRLADGDVEGVEAVGELVVESKYLTRDAVGGRS